MPSINFRATKMQEAKVSHISLVERGANRIPFKVVKQEKDMKSLDLGGLFSRRKSEKQPPQVVAVVTMKGESMEAVKAKVEAAGFAVADVQELEDGSVVFKQAEGELDMEGSTVLRLNDHIALVTKGFSPYNMDVTADGVSFADQCAAKGFYPGVNSIMDTLSDAIRSVVYDAKTPAEARTAVTKLFSEASAYTAAFVAGLPQKAFKLEKLDLPEGEVAKAEKAKAKPGTAKCPECGGEVSETDTECPHCKADLTKGKAKKADGDAGDEGAAGTASSEEEGTVVCKACGGKKKSPEMAKKADGSDDELCAECSAAALAAAAGAGKGSEESAKKSGDSLTEETVSSIVASQVAEHVQKAMDDVMGKLEGFVTTFQAIQKSVSDMQEGLGSVTSRMEEAEKVAKAAKDAVAGTVVIGGDAGDHAPAAAKKSESSGFGREIDTAFMPRVRKPR